MNLIRRLALFCGILTLLAFARISLGGALATPKWLAINALHRTHLPHARAASSACEYAFAGEIAQPQAELCPGEVAPKSIAALRIARVGAGSHLGTPRDLLGSDGTVRWSAAYTAWGKIYEEYVADTQGPRGPPTEPIRSPFRLLGQYYDEETGLSATRFRMWEAETGRWLSPDPLGIAGGDNLFGFCGTTPNHCDPLGLACSEPTEEQLDHAVASIRGLSRDQARAIMKEAFSKNSSVVFGGSRVRGNNRLDSDLDVGFGSLSKSQAGKLIDRQNAQAAQNPSLLKLEETRIVPGNSTRNIATIQSPEEFFARSGTRSDPGREGEPYSPSGSITYSPGGGITDNRVGS